MLSGRAGVLTSMPLSTNATSHAGESLDEFRRAMRQWCADHVPSDWRQSQAGVSHGEFIRFQSWWLRELDSGGLAVPHWPGEWGGGYSLAEQAMIFEELARADAPRLVLYFVSLHHAAATLFGAGQPSTNATCRRSAPARSGARASPSPRPVRTSPRCAPAPSGGAMFMSLTARKSGLAGRPTPHGAYCWLALIPACPSTRASLT